MIFQSLNIDQLEGIIYFFSGIVSSILFALSIYAYKKNAVRKILCAVFAFGFFTLYLMVESFEDVYPTFESSLELFPALITVLVALFFFFAVIKK